MKLLKFSIWWRKHREGLLPMGLPKYVWLCSLLVSESLIGKHINQKFIMVGSKNRMFYQPGTEYINLSPVKEHRSDYQWGDYPTLWSDWLFTFCCQCLQLWDWLVMSHQEVISSTLLSVYNTGSWRRKHSIHLFAVWRKNTNTIKVKCPT